MYYTVYRTTNLVNGKIYIGKHRTKKLEDKYLGSGKLLVRALNKYGEENFKREYLFIFETEEEMIQKEKELVNESFIKRDDTYNLMLGGHGGNPFSNYTDEEMIKLSIRRSLAGVGTHVRSPETLQKMSNARKGFSWGLHTQEWKQMMSEKLTGRVFSEDSIKRMSDSAKLRPNKPFTKECPQCHKFINTRNLQNHLLGLGRGSKM